MTCVGRISEAPSGGAALSTSPDGGYALSGLRRSSNSNPRSSFVGRISAAPSGICRFSSTEPHPTNPHRIGFVGRISAAPSGMRCRIQHTAGWRLRLIRPGSLQQPHPALVTRYPFIHMRMPSRNICVASITRISPINRSSAFTPFSPSRRKNSDDCSRIATVPPQAISSAITKCPI